MLLIGANGNLGLRVLPALLSHGHTVIAFVRAPDKLQSLLTPALFDRITVFKRRCLGYRLGRVGITDVRYRSCRANVRQPRTAVGRADDE